MANQPIDRLVRALEDLEGLRSLEDLRRRLGSTDQRQRLTYEALGL